MLSVPDDRLAVALSNIAVPLQKYLSLQQDVASFGNADHEDDFRRRYSHFYRIRHRDPDWRGSYFGLLVAMRGQSLEFASCLQRFYDLSNRIEASFISKLIATHDPTLPVIDSVVLGHFNLKLKYAGPGRIEQATKVYEDLKIRLNEFLNSRDGHKVVAAFRGAYPGANVTDLKAADFVLWQMR